MAVAAQAIVGGAIADSPHYRTVCGESFPLARLLSARAVVIGTDNRGDMLV
jgi:hypothetical protein